MRTGPAASGSRLLSLDAARPAGVVSAAALGEPFGKDADWVEARTGIQQLRRLADGESAVDLAERAGAGALRRAGLAAPVDLVITATCSSPAGPQGVEQGREVARRVAPDAGWFGINAACSGFSYALATADALIRAGSARHVLVVAVEQMSRLLDPTDLGTSIIFGDGAGAAVVGPAEEGTGVGPLVSGSDGEQAGMIACDADGWLRMQGRSVFRWAVETVPAIAREACARAGVAPGDIDVFVPHQANLRIIDAVVRTLGLGAAVVATDVTTSGNTSAASIPLALAELAERGSAGAGRLALLVGFGAGLAYAGQVVELPSTASGAAAPR